MRLHILGICGTFMTGMAILAKQKGFNVSGSDIHSYPPTNEHLAEQKITVFESYDEKQLASLRPDLVIVGNALTRGNSCIEYVLNQNIPYTSGPQWLAENIIKDRHVLAVAGTHGKTTVASLLSWILTYAKLNPGFLIGGIAKNFNTSAQLGNAPFFVIEADEYDTAFFDKRSKFIHYHPRTLILNNLEFDHADIFPDLKAIQTQFTYLLRTVPSEGRIICPENNKNLKEILLQACWTPIEYTTSYPNSSATWRTTLSKPDASQFKVYYKNNEQGEVCWSLSGEHNVANAISAVAAAQHIGISPIQAITALNHFQGVKRRLEIYSKIDGITLYDDFAHHPTAIAATLIGLRKKVDKARILAILELGTHTMRSNVHRETLGTALQSADKVWMMRPNPDWGIEQIVKAAPFGRILVGNSVSEIIEEVSREAKTHDHIVIMSNRGFEGIHKRLANTLKACGKNSNKLS